MGKEQKAEYYDAVYRKSDQYQKGWESSRYLKVWRRMAERFDPDMRVIDLGCGVGQAAEFLFFERAVKQYIGVDFSPHAIALAQKKFPQSGPYRFICSDLFDYMEGVGVNSLKRPPQEAFQIFCSETLEHIEKDTQLLEMIQVKFPDCRISISVPTFDDPSHVRHFRNAAEAALRYGEHIQIEDLSQLGLWIVIQGRVRAKIDLLLKKS